jgi:hypothetical protein
MVCGCMYLLPFSRFFDYFLHFFGLNKRRINTYTQYGVDVKYMLYCRHDRVHTITFMVGRYI